LSKQSSEANKWAWKAIHKLKSMTKSSKHLRLVLQPDDKIATIVNRAYDNVQAIEKARSEREAHPFESGIELFFCLVLLQAYGVNTEAITSLHDLNDCYDSIASADHSGTHFDLLLEIILGFLSRPSSLFRATAEQVFAAISDSITKEALHSLTKILSTPESLAGQQEIFDANPDDDEYESELDSDVEMVEAVDEMMEKDEESHESDDSDVSEDSEGNEEVALEDNNLAEAEELKAFNEKLAAVLKTRPAEGNDDTASEESHGESMNSEQMMGLDTQLATFFKERRLQSGKKKEKKEARENIINFKRRSLDLLSIYVKLQHANPLAFLLLLPLLQLIRTTKEKSLATKAVEVLKAYYSTCSKTKVLPEFTKTEFVWKILKDIHLEVQEDGSNFHIAACSRASLFVVKVLVNIDRQNYKKALEVYSMTQQTWFLKRQIVISPTFFTEWISWSVETRRQK